MIYYYDSDKFNEMVMQDTFTEMDRLFNNENVYISEAFEDTILGKIISGIFRIIEWIYEKIKELVQKIKDFFSNDVFKKKLSSVDSRTVERGTRTLKYYNAQKIEGDFKQKFQKLEKSIIYYKTNYTKAINTNNIKTLMKDGFEIELNDYAIDSMYDVFNGEGMFNPHFEQMKEPIKEMKDPYVLTKKYDYYQIQEILKKAEASNQEPYKYLGVEPVNFKTTENFTNKLENYTKELEAFSKKIESNKVKYKDEKEVRLYNALEKTTKGLLKQIAECSEVALLITTKCNELKIYDNFFKYAISNTDDKDAVVLDNEATMLESALDMITEAYIGKTKTLLEIEKQVGLIRQKALTKFTDINKSPEVLKLNRLFEKQFGMECFCLSIVQESTINAYTMPVQRRFDIAFAKNISKYVEGDKVNGFRWKEGNGLCINVYIYLGVLQDEIFTDGEIVAILLHELGHNFADAIYDDIKYDNIYGMYIVGIVLIYQTIFYFILKLLGQSTGPNPVIQYLNYRNDFNKVKAKRKYKSIIKGLFSGFTGTVQDISNFIGGIFHRVFYARSYENYKLQAGQAVKDEMKKSLGRQNEVIADKFAGIYGYGPEQVSALMKLENKKSSSELFMEMIPVLKKFSDAYNLAVLDITDYDVHPHNIQRAMEEIKLLEREINKADCDPKMKKILQEQIDEIKEIMNETMKLRKNSSNYEQQKAIYYKLVHDKYPDAITDELEDAIENAFDKVLEGDNKK